MRIEPLVTEFAITTAKVILYIVVIVSALSSLGIQTHSLVAAIGAATLAVGLALQNSLSNLAAGILLAGNKVFKKLVCVEINGVAGKIESVGLLTTTLRTIDNKTVTIPNNSCLSNNIINFSNFPTRRLDLRVSIASEDDVVEAKRLLTDLFVSSPLVIDKSDFLVGVESFGEYGVNLLARVWVPTENVLAAQMELLEEIKAIFDESKITIPYPRVDISGFAEYSLALARGQSEAMRAPEKIITSKE
ncbi:MAG: mechanosensitive ion channel domain-containing protein [Pseudomonadota bacterium]|nr:mechanosensitive ion channel domain-containing protein [Pseudomonadota bacterium]